MLNSIRTDMINVDGAELTEHLLTLGFTNVSTMLQPDGLHISAEGTGDLESALDSFIPTADRGDWIQSLPDNVRTHLVHLRDYRDASPASITSAQTVHVVQDLIRAVFLLNDRFESEG